MTVQLLLGDCLERMKEIPDGSVDMVLCDLPYGTTACKWDSVIPFEKLWEAYERVCKSNAAIVLFGAQPFTSLLICSNLEMFKYQYVWVKNTQTGIALAKIQPMRKHEDICVFYKKQPIFNKQMVETESDIMKNHSSKGYTRGSKKTVSEHLPNMQLDRGDFSLLINPSTVLKFNVVPNRSKLKTHPTEKPVKLLEHLVSTYTHEGCVVLDNTMGTGSTGVACKNLNRSFIGIEMDAGYFNIATQRIEAI